MRHFQFFLLLFHFCAGFGLWSTPAAAQSFLDTFKQSLTPPKTAEVPSALCTVRPPQKLDFMMAPQVADRLFMIHSGGAQMTVEALAGQSGKALESEVAELFSEVKRTKRTKRAYAFDAVNNVFGQRFYVYGYALAPKSPGPALYARIQHTAPIEKKWKAAIDKLVTGAKCRRPPRPEPIAPFSLGGVFSGATVTFRMPRGGVVVKPGMAPEIEYQWPWAKLAIEVTKLKTPLAESIAAVERKHGSLGTKTKFKRGVLYRGVRGENALLSYFEKSGGAVMTIVAVTKSAHVRRAKALLSEVVDKAKRVPVRESKMSRKVAAFIEGRQFLKVRSGGGSQIRKYSFCRNGRVKDYFHLAMYWTVGSESHSSDTETSDWGSWTVVDGGSRGPRLLIDFDDAETEDKNIAIAVRNDRLVLGNTKYITETNDVCN